ncbi:MAG: competence protein CoiA family protein [Anaeromyxobacter sp.]
MRRRRTPVKHPGTPSKQRPSPVRPERRAAQRPEVEGQGPTGAAPRAAGAESKDEHGPRAPRALQGDVQLAWALDKDGQKVHAKRLGPLDRRARAPFTCLGCGEELIPHLGEVRARHFAHRAGSSCPLTAPETALHLDAKERLLGLCADAFAGRRRVTVLSRCPRCRRLAPRDLASEGDWAVPEGAVGALRADVLIMKGGAPALAFEVLVTHAVDAEKEAALTAAGVPAVEIDAAEPWEQPDGDGVAIACLRSLAFPPCPACQAQSRADQDRDKGGEAAQLAELEAYRARGLLRAVGDPPPGQARPYPAEGCRGNPEAPISADEEASLRQRFHCPECGGDQIALGQRIARHPCPAAGDRPVAWRGYDGGLVELGWWQRARG